MLLRVIQSLLEWYGNGLMVANRKLELMAAKLQQLIRTNENKLEQTRAGGVKLH